LRWVARAHPRVISISVHPDDVAKRNNVTKAYLRSIPLYDVHFTYRAPNLDDLRARGARVALRTWFAFDSRIHRPVAVSENDRSRLGGQVGFIGAYERKRAKAMIELAKAGVPMRVWGIGRWRQPGVVRSKIMLEPRPVWGEEYAKAICSFDINLGFLRVYNRDQHTQRSFEIPACAGFMLAERTDEHMALFEEGKEAEFFGSIEELIDKARFYLGQAQAREKIGRAGRERCLRSGYDNESRLREMLAQAVRAKQAS
jgi:hypothetical protein